MLQSDTDLFSKNLLESLARTLPILAVLLPVSGVLVRWVAFTTSGVPVQDPLYLALGAPLNELVATGANASWILIFFVPGFALLRIAVNHDNRVSAGLRAFEAESSREIEKVEEKLADLQARRTNLEKRQADNAADIAELQATSARLESELEELGAAQTDAAASAVQLADMQTRQSALGERTAAALAESSEVSAAYAQWWADYKDLTEELETIRNRLKSSADTLVAESQHVEPQGLPGRYLALASGRWGAITVVLTQSAMIVLVVVAPGFPLSLITVIGVYGSMALAVVVTRGKTVTFVRVLPSTLILLFVLAIASGVGDNVITQVGIYSFKAGTVGVSNGSYVQMADWGDTTTLARCGDHSGRLTTVQNSEISSINVPPSASEALLPSLLSVLEGSHPELGFQFC